MRGSPLVTLQYVNMGGGDGDPLLGFNAWGRDLISIDFDKKKKIKILTSQVLTITDAWCPKTGCSPHIHLLWCGFYCITLGSLSEDAVVSCGLIICEFFCLSCLYKNTLSGWRSEGSLMFLLVPWWGCVQSHSPLVQFFYRMSPRNSVLFMHVTFL